MSKPLLTYGAVEVGQSLGPIRYRADPGLVLGHLRALGQVVSPFLEDADTGKLLIEPGIYVRNYIRLLRAHFTVQGAIHARTQVDLQRPAPAGEVLTVSGCVVEKYVRRERPYVVVESTTRDDSGQVLCHERNTVLLTLEER